MTISILLLGLGLALIIAEVLFPSFGILSVLAAGAIVSAIVFAFNQDPTLGWRFLWFTALAVPAAIMLGMRLFPKSPFGRRMVVHGLSFESTRATDRRDLGLVGAEGVTLSPCRPAGTARLGTRRVDVVSRGEFLEAGQPVHVVEVVGNRVVVAPLESA
ncbi:MAG: NfeD family protein [Planctomycetota bacterium]